MDAVEAPLGRREKRKQEIRARIEDAAYRLFKAHGIEETSIEQICVEADVARRTFYGHFPNKHALLGGLGVSRVYNQSEPMLQALMANLASDSTSEAAPAAEESAGPEPKIIIENFAFTNARTSLNSDILGEKAVEIPDIRLTGIGEKSQGVTIREALKQILDPIVQASTEALAKEGLNVDLSLIHI